ncbi:MAG: alpha/beta hydrolase-fold protein, partial [Pacificimonas sp.]
ALTIGLRNAERFRSISAFSPICAPTTVSWGQKAFPRYLGEDESHWQQYDATALLASGARHPHLKIDQGLDDEFLEEQLQTGLFRDACTELGQPLELGLHGGYDHSYYFISSFMADHVAWHRERLG